MLKTTLLFFATALAEIIGCFLPYLWLKKQGSAWLLLPAALSMMLFVWLLTLHPAASGRVYAAYGGVYVATALLWLRVVDGVKLSTLDWVGAAVDFQPSEGLADRHHFQRVDVDARRQCGDPEYRLGDVFRRQRIGAFVGFIDLAVIALEAHVGEFGAAHQARLDIGHADARAVQIGAQAQTELLDERLGGAVHVAAGIGPVGGGRTDVDHVADVALLCLSKRIIAEHSPAPTGLFYVC